MRPTRAPLWRSARARFTATVLLPTPPLPEATAIVLRTPGSTAASAVGGVERCPRVLLVMRTSTERTPGRAATRSRAAFSNSALTGQAGGRGPAPAAPRLVVCGSPRGPSTGPRAARRGGERGRRDRRGLAARRPGRGIARGRGTGDAAARP